MREEVNLFKFSVIVMMNKVLILSGMRIGLNKRRIGNVIMEVKVELVSVINVIVVIVVVVIKKIIKFSI